MSSRKALKLAYTGTGGSRTPGALGRALRPPITGVQRPTEPLHGVVDRHRASYPARPTGNELITVFHTAEYARSRTTCAPSQSRALERLADSATLWLAARRSCAFCKMSRLAARSRFTSLDMTRPTHARPPCLRNFEAELLSRMPLVHLRCQSSDDSKDPPDAPTSTSPRLAPAPDGLTPDTFDTLPPRSSVHQRRSAEHATLLASPSTGTFRPPPFADFP